MSESGYIPVSAGGNRIFFLYHRLIRDCHLIRRFATMMQKDLKYINAYSSVSHCGFVLLGIGMLTRTAVSGAVMQMVSHGLMTALFFAVIGMIYSRTHTRQVSRWED